MHYSGYSKFSVEPFSCYEFDGLEINNNSAEEFHIFLKKLDDIDIEVENTEISNDHHRSCCCSQCLEEKL